MYVKRSDIEIKQAAGIFSLNWFDLFSIETKDSGDDVFFIDSRYNSDITKFEQC
jgi:hypothetical protein